jgi:sigma-B regulation protein RsbU (phosphoserine phosphatase)
METLDSLLNAFVPEIRVPPQLLLLVVLIVAGIVWGFSILITSYGHKKTELKQRLKEKQLLEEELQVARQVQVGFLPSGTIEIEGFDVSTFFRSAKEVGGDYFDVIPLKKGVGIVIADVSGKGVPAALVMANLHATLHVLTEDCSLDELVTRINRSIFKDTPPHLFVTFFYGVLDHLTGEFTYVNAGHNPPLVARKDGTVEKLIQGGTVLGIIPDSKFQTCSIILNSKDLLLLYTDGLTEAGLPEIDPWGEDNLTNFLVEIRQKTASSITDLIIKQVEESTKGIVQTDDIALVLLKRD